MVTLLLFCLLAVVCWPLALVALVLYPVVWVVLLPFRLVGLVVGGVFEMIGAIFYLPVRVLRAVQGTGPWSAKRLGRRLQ